MSLHRHRTLAVLLALPAAAAAQRTINGTANNLAQPMMGAAGTELQRAAGADYEDGSSVPAGASRPSPRTISNLLCTQWGPLPNKVGASDFVWQWGQFLDHDLDLSGGANPAEPFDVNVPLGDTFFDPTYTDQAVIRLDRSLYHMVSGVREQVNELTAWIDASNVYGSDLARALALRTLDGTGRLRVHSTPVGDLLPLNTTGLPNAPSADDPRLFVAGDVRANEQSGLAAMHTLFVREHNTIASILYVAFQGVLSDDDIYEFTRMIVGAEMQVITYNEFLPVVLGPDAIPPYTGYDPSVDASIRNEFSTAAYRFGHTMLSPRLQRLDAGLQSLPGGPLALRDAFFRPDRLFQDGIEPLLRGLAMQKAQDIDLRVVDDVRNFLFGLPGAGGLDLPSLNIQRGRDHGLAAYNDVREAYGLPRVSAFAQITQDPFAQVGLNYLYYTPDEIDLWVGVLAEDEAPGSLLGPLGTAVLADQFRRLRDGDRFWYQNALSGALQRFVESQRLSDIIRRNTTIGAELQADVFHVPAN